MSSSTTQRVALYARVSTSEQARSGVSLAQQEHELRAYAGLYGFDVVEMVVDAGESGKTLDRPGMGHLRALMAEGAIDGIVITKLDRLGRNVRDFLNLLHEFEAHGVSLASVSDRIDTGSAAGRLLLHVMIAVAEWERDTIASRIRDALAETRRQGTYLGQPPVGYRVEEGRLVPTDRIAAVVRAHDLRSEGRSMQSIAVQLERDGILTGSGRTKWYPSQVKRLLDAPHPATLDRTVA